VATITPLGSLYDHPSKQEEFSKHPDIVAHVDDFRNDAIKKLME